VSNNIESQVMTGIDLSYTPATRHATVVTVISAPRFFFRRRRVLLIFELSFSGRKSKSEYNATGPKTPKTTQTVILTYDVSRTQQSTL
jgi:hypothetical protein